MISSLRRPSSGPVSADARRTERRSPMSRSLTPDSSLENVRKDAKRWLKALRAGDADARRRLLAVLSGAPADPGLRDVQLALAREYGFPGWTALRHALDDLTLARRSHAERVETVLRSATWQGDRGTATRLLKRWPEIGAANLYTAVSTGNLAEVERRLAVDPGAAARKGGPWSASPCFISPMRDCREASATASASPAC